MKKILAIVLSILMVVTIIPVAMISSSAEVVKANVLNITNENINNTFRVRTNTSKNNSLTNVVTEGVSVLEDGSLCIEMPANTTIGKIDFRFLRNAIDADLLEAAGGKAVAHISTENANGLTLLHSRFPFSKTTNTSVSLESDGTKTVSGTFSASDIASIGTYANDINESTATADTVLFQFYHSSNSTFTCPTKIVLRVYVEVDESVLEEETTVPTEPEEETTTTTTTTTQTPSDDGEAVVKELIAGGEWVEGFWRNGVVDQSTDNASNNKRASYNAFLKVLPNTTYTITTKLSRSSTVANAVYYKEYDANKTQLSSANYSAYDLGSNFTKKVTTFATTEYITITLWSTFDSTQTGVDLYKNILNALESGDIAVSIVGEVSVDELEVSANMKKGAALRLGEVNGLRFTTYVDAQKIEELQAKGATVQAGTLIAPHDLLGTNELTFDLAQDSYLDVEFDISKGYYNEDGTVVGSIVNIKESNTKYSEESGNITRKFVGRGYVKVTLDGRTYISYANYEENKPANNSRSLKNVSIYFRADDTQADLYNQYKEKVDKWVDAILAAISVTDEMVGGNIIVQNIEENEDGSYTVTVKNDLRTTTEDWFYWAFKVEGAQGKKVTFKFSQSNRVGPYGAAVSHDLETWDWTNTKSGEGFTYTFSQEDTTVYFAHSMLYHPERFYDVADELNLEVKTLCTSEGGNAVPYVEFGNGDKGIVLTARHHACESTGSYVLEGVLKQLATSDYIKENYKVMVVPFMDIDGVLAGDQGKRRSPHDHNNDYLGELGETDKSIYASVRAVREYLEDPANNVVQAYDSHSPWHTGGDNDSIFVYKKFAPGTERADNLDTLLSMFKNNIDSNCFPYTGANDQAYGASGNVGTDGSVSTGFSGYMTKIPTLVCGTTFETAYFKSNGVKFSQENAVNTGKALGSAIIEFSKTLDK